MIKIIKELVFTLWKLRLDYIISKLFGIFIMIYNKSELWSGC